MGIWVCCVVVIQTRYDRYPYLLSIQTSLSHYVLPIHIEKYFDDIYTTSGDFLVWEAVFFWCTMEAVFFTNFEIPDEI